MEQRQIMLVEIKWLLFHHVSGNNNVVSHGLNRNDMTIYYMKITDYDFL